MKNMVATQLFARKTNSVSMNPLQFGNIFYAKYTLASLLILFIQLLSLSVSGQNIGTLKKLPRSQPLVSNFYTADPSAHVFEG
ncbi:MAG: hypothetical protein EBX50_21935, partial [Chitinophagia bacterium]|nr:hypothetical protein [Chitinophagia bacterium]